MKVVERETLAVDQAAGGKGGGVGGKHWVETNSMHLSKELDDNDEFTPHPALRNIFNLQAQLLPLSSPTQNRTQLAYILHGAN